MSRTATRGQCAFVSIKFPESSPTRARLRRTRGVLRTSLWGSGACFPEAEAIWQHPERAGWPEGRTHVWPEVPRDPCRGGTDRFRGVRFRFRFASTCVDRPDQQRRGHGRLLRLRREPATGRGVQPGARSKRLPSAPRVRPRAPRVRDPRTRRGTDRLRARSTRARRSSSRASASPRHGRRLAQPTMRLRVRCERASSRRWSRRRPRT